MFNVSPEILCNMCIVICCPGCEVINFEIKLAFLFKPFSYMTKKLEQKFKYLQNGKSFLVEIKIVFHHFKAFSAARNFLRTESTPLNRFSGF